MKESAVVVVTRGSGESLEVLWSQREHSMAFLGGFWAFPGGSVDEGDEEIPISGHLPDAFPDRRYYGCAGRELFEEHGLLVTNEGLEHVSEHEDLAILRERVLDGGDFAEALRQTDRSIPVDRFWPIAHWMTPEWFDVRFDTEFFAIQLEGTEADRLGRALTTELFEAELIEAEWIRPAEALAQWHRGEKFITPPIRFLLEALDEAKSARDVDVDSSTLEFGYDAWLAVDGIYLIPLRSPTIPPATHTNCLIVGEDRLLIIDPGSPYGDQQALLARLLDAMVDDGRQLEAVVLTHHHPDHIGGVAAVVERYGCEVWAHPRTAELVGDDFEIDRTLADGEVIGHARDTMRIIHTPGHASDHICLLHERTRALIAGDLIASNGTILVNPPDGHMGSYLDSLRTARELEPTAIYPAHGWVVTDPITRLDYYEDHRLEREEKVFAALRRHSGPATAMDLVPDAYDDAPMAVWPLAARSAQAHLEHLVELGRAATVGDRWRVVGS